MVTLFAFEFTQQLDVGIGGTPRKTYEEGERVICTREDFLTLHRLGCKQIGQADVSFDQLKDFIFQESAEKAKKSDKKKAPEAE